MEFCVSVTGFVELTLSVALFVTVGLVVLITDSVLSDIRCSEIPGTEYVSTDVAMPEGVSLEVLNPYVVKVSLAIILAVDLKEELLMSVLFALIPIFVVPSVVPDSVVWILDEITSLVASSVV